MSESDNIEKFLEKYKNIQEAFLEFIDDEENIEVNIQILKQLLGDTKSRDYKHHVRLFLSLLLQISNCHHRGPNFFSKIDRILHLFSDDIKKYNNDEIFQLFQSNKRLLLFLIEEKILTVDEYFVKQIGSEKYLSKKYPQYFMPEIKPFMEEEWFTKFDSIDEYLQKKVWIEDITKKMPDNFYENRKNEENSSYLMKLIREDLVEDFIVHVNKFGIKRNSTITPSIYETNSFLLKKHECITMIEYAAFLVNFFNTC